MPGTLHVVSTPIGNMEDLTPRAIRILKEVDLIAAEDTRRTGMLLKRLEIRKPLISYFKFNEARRSEEILDKLRSGLRIALVTDAGTPGISDPGERIVREAVEQGISVEPIPGACAFVAALMASGLPTQEFHFAGFLPQKSGKRIKELERLKSVPGTIILYESPHRIEKLIQELAAVVPDRKVVIGRELTKKFEEFLRGTPPQLIEQLSQRKLKGEMVVLIGPE